MNRSRCWESGAPGEGRESLYTIPPLTLLPYFSLYVPFTWLFLVCILYNKPVLVNKALSWVPWAIPPNFWSWTGHRSFQFIAKLDRRMGTMGTQYLCLVFEMMAKLWDWDLNTCGSWHQLRIVSELNWILEHPVGVWSGVGLWKKSTHLVSDMWYVKKWS